MATPSAPQLGIALAFGLSGSFYYLGHAIRALDDIITAILRFLALL